MTITEERATAAAPEPPSRPRRRGRVVAWAVIASIAVLAVVGLLVWQSLVQSALGGVRVTYDADPVRCQGAEVGLFPGITPDGEYPDDVPYELYFDEEFHRPLVDLERGMRCTLRIHVINDGWAEVRVTQLLLRHFGESSGLAVQAVGVSPNGSEPLQLTDSYGFPDAIDAAFAIEGGLGVPAGFSQMFVAVFEYGNDASMGTCGATSVNVPVMTVEALGQSATAAPTEDQVIAFRIPDANGCD